MEKIDCSKCSQMDYCCQEGVSLDLEEAKKILALGLGGEFFHLDLDEDFPSGYRIDTSSGSNSCTFLDSAGLCSIHKLKYELKPTPCKEFPHDNDEVSSDAKYLCLVFKQQMTKRKKNGRI